MAPMIERVIATMHSRSVPWRAMWRAAHRSGSPSRPTWTANASGNRGVSSTCQRNPRRNSLCWTNRSPNQRRRQQRDGTDTYPRRNTFSKQPIDGKLEPGAGEKGNGNQTPSERAECSLPCPSPLSLPPSSYDEQKDNFYAYTARHSTHSMDAEQSRQPLLSASPLPASLTLA